MNLPAIPSLAAGAGAGALLAGAPWWAVLLSAAVIIVAPPLVTQARLWAKDRRDGKIQESGDRRAGQLQEELIAATKELPPEKRAQVIIEYRKADAFQGGVVEPGAQDSAPEPRNTPADPQGP